MSNVAMPGGPWFVVPSNTPSKACRGPNCRADVFFVDIPGGRMPVDVNVVGGVAPTVTEPGQGISHFATCPDAPSFRRREQD